LSSLATGRRLIGRTLGASITTTVNQLMPSCGRSFIAYSDRIMDAAERKALLLLRALPFVAETPLPVGIDKSHDNFPQYEAAFNDLSVLVFPNAEAAVQDEELAERMAQVAVGVVDMAPGHDELITSQKVAIDV